MPSRSLVSLALLGLALVGRAEDSSIARMRAEIEAARRKEGVVGMSVAVVKDGRVVFCEGFGRRDAAHRLPVTADTVYEIGSATKSFTALLVAQAAQEGRLSLADRPSKYLPAFRLKDPQANARITLEDLLSHRSGLPRTDLAWYAGDFSRDELLELVSESEATAPLGKAWQYQNLMFLFSGMIAEKVYGQPYESLLRERFFLPLGMAHSGSTYAETRAEPQLATGYQAKGMRSADYPLPLKPIDRIAPAGSISSTARDMARYLQMLLGGGELDGQRPFARAAIEETRKPRIEITPGSGQFYGLGWMLGEEHGAKSVYHGGNIDGFTAFVSMIPEKGIGVVALSNGNGAATPQAVAKIVYDALLPRKAEAPSAAYEAATDAELGDYRLAQPPVDLSFSREGKALTMTQNGRKIPLELVGAKRYTIQKALYLTFGVPGPDGKPAVKLEQGGGTFLLTRPLPYRAPLAPEALLAKAVEAQGGAEAIRRQSRMVVHYLRRMPSDAVEAYGVRYRRDVASVADFALFYGAGRRFAESTTEIEPGRAVDVTSFSPPDVRQGKASESDATLANLEADLRPNRAYRSLEIVREDVVGAEPVYVLRKTTPSGERIEESISTQSFRVLRRVAGAGLSRTQDDFSDFRTVDGLTMPFHTVSTNAVGSKSVEDVLSVRSDEPVPAWPWSLGRAH